MQNLKTVEFFLNYCYFSLKIVIQNIDKLLSGTYEYEYEEYPDEDNFASNTPQDTTTTTTSLGSTKKFPLGQIYLQPLKKSLLKLPIIQKCQQQNVLNTI